MSAAVLMPLAAIECAVLRSSLTSTWPPEASHTAMSVTLERIQLAISSSTHATAFAEIL